MLPTIHIPFAKAKKILLIESFSLQPGPEQAVGGLCHPAEIPFERFASLLVGNVTFIYKPSHFHQTMRG